MPSPSSRPRAILITGASSGIGADLAVALAPGGTRLVLAGRDAARLEASVRAAGVAGADASALVADLAQPGAARGMVEEALARLGALDVLVNNAGYGVSAFLADLPRAELERLFAVNVHAAVEATAAALPALRASRGLVVNVGSVLGHRGVPVLGAYCMTKAALRSFSDALRAEEARHGVGVLQVDPGATATPFSEHRVIVGDHPRFFRSSFVMESAAAARSIARAIARRRSRLLLGLPGRLLVLGERCAPWLVDWALARAVARHYGKGQRSSA